MLVFMVKYTLGGGALKAKMFVCVVGFCVPCSKGTFLSCCCDLEKWLARKNPRQDTERKRMMGREFGNNQSTRRYHKPTKCSAPLCYVPRVR